VKRAPLQGLARDLEQGLSIFCAEFKFAHDPSFRPRFDYAHHRRPPSREKELHAGKETGSA